MDDKNTVKTHENKGDNTVGTEKKEALLKELQEAELTLPKQESASIIGAGSPQKFTASPLRDNVLGFMIKIVIDTVL